MRGPFFVYILCSAPGGMLYVGVTNDIARRSFEHRSKEVESYTKAHGIDRLVYVEDHATVETAILREKRLKRWRRAWKIALIEQVNPTWRDLHEVLNA